MDDKGDAIFRPRPFFPVIESMAMIRLRSGHMPDTIAQSLVEHRTMLVLRRRLPPASDTFVETSYLPVTGDVWMAGMYVASERGMRTVDLALPGDYVLTAGTQRLRASIDGGAVSDSWNLGVGKHQIDTTIDRALLLVWRQAWERGWRPAVVRPPAEGAGARACQ